MTHRNKGIKEIEFSELWVVTGRMMTKAKRRFQHAEDDKVEAFFNGAKEEFVYSKSNEFYPLLKKIDLTKTISFFVTKEPVSPNKQFTELRDDDKYPRRLKILVKKFAKFHFFRVEFS